MKGFYHVGGDADGVTGHRTGPGSYSIQMTVGEEVFEAPLEIQWDPRLETSSVLIAEQQEALQSLRMMIDELHRSVTAMTAVKSQAAQYKGVLEETAGDEEAITAAKTLIEAIDEWRDSVANFDRKGFQDVLNFPDRLSTDLQFLYGEVDETTSGLTKGMVERMADLKAKWDEAMTARDGLLNDEVAAFNTALLGADVARVVLPPFTEAEALAAQEEREAREGEE